MGENALLFPVPSIQGKIVLKKSSSSIVHRPIFPAGPINLPGNIFDPVSKLK